MDDTATYICDSCGEEIEVSLDPSAGNQQYFYDGINWLTHQEALSGTTENEEDVRIEHTKEGQAGWFYLTVVGLPLLIFGLGMLRLRIRRKGGLK